MIHVLARPAPAGFAVKVGVPGAAYLANNPTSKPKEKWEAHWREALPDLAGTYKHICAYYCCRVEEVTGAGSVDHYLPKSKHRALAYTWSNFRFACSRMNARKHNGNNVLDPFVVPDGWFELDFATMAVRAANLPNVLDVARVQATIDKLKLNDATSLRERLSRWRLYNGVRADADILIEYAPFIALEAVRLGKLRPPDRHLTAADIRRWLDS